LDDGHELYIEDNIITTNDLFTDGTRAARYVARYNTINITDGDAVSPLFDAHGNQPTNICGTMEASIYGNYVIDPYNKIGTFFDQRGGMSAVFLNRSTNSPSAAYTIRNEYAETGSAQCNTTNPQPQYVTNSYYWANHMGEAAIPRYSISDCCSEQAENLQFWLQRNGTFDGTGSVSNGGGVGCGPIASRSLTCTPGVAYWATGQSCTDLAGMVGANPSTPISGTLYKCTAPDTWTAYYTPYTYPHPLRGEATLEGDVNADGLVDIADIRACLGHILGTQDWGEAADVNGDGKVDALDIQWIVNNLLD
jgi:hypothetical protein